MSQHMCSLIIAPIMAFLKSKDVSLFCFQECNQQGKPVMVTRVVDTMTDAPRPTRAEATDIANLVLDGADCILLGAETFRGNYPVETVKTVAAICRQAEKAFDSETFYQSLVEDRSGREGEWKGSKVSIATVDYCSEGHLQVRDR